MIQEHDSIELSIVIPVYREGRQLAVLADEIDSALREVVPSYEVIYVEDGSNDESWSTIQLIIKKYPRSAGFRLARNYGQHVALIAGMRQTTGKVVVLMDCDGQDAPGEIPKLLKRLDSGFDIVYAQRKSRTQSAFQRLQNRFFTHVFSFLTGTDWVAEVGTFRVMTRKVCDAFCCYNETRPVVGALFFSMGFRSTFEPVLHRPRSAGRSNYNLSRRIKLALNAIFSFSIVPLRLSSLLGLIFSVSGLIGGLYVILRSLLDIDFQSGWPSLIVSVWIIGGVMLLMIGILSEYVGRIFEQVKQRPLFFIAEKIARDSE